MYVCPVAQMLSNAHSHSCSNNSRGSPKIGKQWTQPNVKLSLIHDYDSCSMMPKGTLHYNHLNSYVQDVLWESVLWVLHWLSAILIENNLPVTMLCPIKPGPAVGHLSFYRWSIVSIYPTNDKWIPRQIEF